MHSKVCDAQSVNYSLVFFWVLLPLKYILLINNIIQQSAAVYWFDCWSSMKADI